MNNEKRMTTITEQIIQLTSKDRVRWADVGNETYVSNYSDVKLTFCLQTQMLTFTDTSEVEDQFDLSNNKLGHQLAKSIVDFIQRRVDLKSNVLDKLFETAKPTPDKREALNIYGRQLAEEMVSLFDDIIDATNPNLPKDDTVKDSSFPLGDLYAFLKNESKFEIHALVDAGVACVIVPDHVIEEYKQTFDKVKITIDEKTCFTVNHKEGLFYGVRYENNRLIPEGDFSSDDMGSILSYVSKQLV